MLFEPCNYADQKARIMVVGIGGAGGNALNRMIEDGLKDVEFVAINTDAQDLENNNSQSKLQIGKELTKGLGAGANAEVGRQASEESREAISSILDGADMVFITAGMGGGTGTGSAPVIAQIARECNALTVGVVTKPFSFEGPKRSTRALDGIKELKKNCDTLLVIPNEVLLTITDLNTSVTDSFKCADSILHQATKGISDLININGQINLDFADVRKVMENMGEAMMGTGIAHGEERAILAAQQAINSPLLQDVCIKGAKGILINITGPEDLSIHELKDASTIIYEEAGEKAETIMGYVVDKSLKDEIIVTVIATGLGKQLGEDEKLPHKSGTEPIDTPLRNIRMDRGNDMKDEGEIHAEPTFVKKQTEFQENSLENGKSEDSEEILTFGDDYDVPAFIRNRKQGPTTA